MTELTDKRVSVRREDHYRHRVTVRQHEFELDEPSSLGGSDTAASPLELLAAALGTCTASTVAMYAERRGWQLASLEVDVHFTPPQSGERGRFGVMLRLPPHLDGEQVERLQSIARKCPVRRTLEGADVLECAAMPK